MHKDIFDHEAIKQFYNNVMFPFFPKARHKSIAFFGHAEVQRAGSITIDMADSNSFNIDSPYYYTKPYTFIHYTSVQALISILRSKKIRMYNLHGMDDKEEFIIPLKHIGKELSDFAIKELRSKIFCLSMVESRLEENKNSLTAWRTYGASERGVGIELTFNRSHAHEWVYFMLSKVHYDSASAGRFKKMLDAYNNFAKTYNMEVRNFERIMFKYFSFHKDGKFKDEREVRLVYCEGFGSSQQTQIHLDLNSANKQTSFIELDLEWEWDNETKQFIISQGIHPRLIHPQISVSKIYFGPKISQSDKHEIAYLIHHLVKDYKTKPVMKESKLFIK